jgi:5-methylcytosine-specific restriction endonuclease McrA
MPKSLYSSHPWYHTTFWRKLRKQQLDKEPLCAVHLRRGLERPASIVDHIKPFGESRKLFEDPNNLQSLCPMCHISAKKIQQNKGIMPGCDENGLPLDSNHEWSAK